MTRNASSWPARNIATSCSSERRRRSGPPSGVRGRATTAGAWIADASTGTPRRLYRVPRAPGAVFRPRAWSGEGHHHVLDLGVVLERVHAQVFAVPGLLEPAVGHLGGQRD